MGICIDCCRVKDLASMVDSFLMRSRGKGAGIIEDCGGVWALNEMMQEEKAYGDPDDEDSLLVFDKEAINIALS